MHRPRNKTRSRNAMHSAVNFLYQRSFQIQLPPIAVLHPTTEPNFDLCLSIRTQAAATRTSWCFRHDDVTASVRCCRSFGTVLYVSYAPSCVSQ